MSANADTLTWLAEYQRARCDGRSALTTFQGLLADEIVVPRSAADASDPAALVHAAAGFCRRMQEGAMLLPGEFAQEALWSFQVEYYRVQVSEGGHAQYVVNSGWTPIAVRGCAAGLKSMLADPHHDNLKQLAKLIQAEPAKAKKIAKAGGFSSVDAAIAECDRRFAEIEEREPLLVRHRTWLKSLRKLTIAPDAEAAELLKRIAANNPLRARRQVETAEAQRALHENDPAHRAAATMCAAAGLRFGGAGQGVMSAVRSIWPEGPARRGYAVAVVTDQGPRTALFFAERGLMKKRRAVLIEPGDALPVADLVLKRDEFEEIVPEAARRG